MRLIFRNIDECWLAYCAKPAVKCVVLNYLRAADPNLLTLGVCEYHAKEARYHIISKENAEEEALVLSIMLQ